MFTPAPKLSAKWLVAAVFGATCSLAAFHWLLSLPREAHATQASRVGFACSAYCIFAVALFCWGTILGYFARARKWSPKKCRLMGLTFFVPLVAVLLMVDHGRFTSLFEAFFAAGILAGFVCQKLTYPHVSSDELNAPEPPLSLFPK